MHSDLFGRYRIQSEIGRGGMASVYLAYDPRFQRQVAVKVLTSQFLASPILRARFEREARLIATIEHPAIVPVYDFGEHDGQLYLVMRYMPGGTLSTQLRSGPLPLQRIIQILGQLAPALDAVHARGVVHRDLKPGNILFDGFDNPALSDFGIAYLSEATVQLTGDAIIGTPAYMSPEQVQANVELDGRSDIYALGVVLYEMLTGRQPYRSATPLSAALKHLSEPVPQARLEIPGLPAEVDHILAKAMAKDREGRYQKASDLVFDLRALPEGPPDTTGAAQQQPPRTDLDALTELETGGPAGRNPGQASIPPPQPLEAASPTAGAARVPAGAPAGPAGQARPPSRRAGFLALGLGGVVLTGLFLLGGLVYLLAIRPGRGIAPQTPVPNQALQSSPSPTFSSPTEAPAPNPVDVLLADDFSEPANGWPQEKGDAASYLYDEGAYRITVQEKDSLFWAAPNGRFEDASIQASATLASGGAESYFGLLCRLQDARNFYYLVIRSDGSYTIGKVQDSEFRSLLPGGWDASQAIRTGSQQNQLRADCIQDRLRFYVNGELLAEVQDADFLAGKVALGATSIGPEALDVRFDDFLVTAP